MSERVKRYNMDTDKFGAVRPYESEHGRWTKHSAYAALEAERDALRAELAALKAPAVAGDEREGFDLAYSCAVENGWESTKELARYMWDQAGAARQRARPAQTPADGLVEALEFYARGDHLMLADPDAWDTCSGEAENWLHDDEGTASVEDGSLAKAALAAHRAQGDDE